MTDAEKKVAKGMNQLICDLVVRQSLFHSVLTAHVPDSPSKVASMSSSPQHMKLSAENERLRQIIDDMIDQDSFGLVHHLTPDPEVGPAQ